MPEAATGIMAPDEQLVDLACRGDLAAREELFRRHFGVAYRVAHRLLGNEQDALDAVQDGFIKAVAHLDDFDGRSGFRTWLMRVVHNAALDAGRRRKRRPAASMAQAEREGAEPTVHEDPARGLRRQDLRRTLDAALARLGGETRETFILFAEAGLSYKDIAAAQGIAIGTVMSRLHYARQKLQGFLADVDGI